MNRLQNKVAVITGGNSGIGLATAQEFIRQGAKVVISGRDQKTLDEAKALLGNDALAIRSDVTLISDLDNLFAQTQKTFGKIDILFANAGVAQFAPFEQTDEQLLDVNMDINFKGTFFTIQKALPYFNTSASVIINTSIVNVKGMASTTAYAASKAALRSLVRTLATELIGKGIRVNSIAPGPILTPIYQRLGLPAEALQGFQSGLEQSNPMKRFGQPEEVAKAALFLASSESSYTTGSEIAVDGGLTQL